MVTVERLRRQDLSVLAGDAIDENCLCFIVFDQHDQMAGNQQRERVSSDNNANARILAVCGLNRHPSNG